MTVQLVDLSHFNGSVDLGKLKSAGIDGVIHKATQGIGYTDPRYHERRAQAKAAGMPFGGYHFLEPDSDPHAQVAHFLAVIGGDYEIRPALDHEKRSQISVAHCAQTARTFAANLATRLGYPPLVYTDKSFATEGNCAGLGGYPLWYARSGRFTFGTLDVPAPWSRKRLVLWQEGQRQVPGASAGDGPGVDYDTAPSLAPLLVPGITPTQGVDMPLTNDDVLKILTYPVHTAWMGDTTVIGLLSRIGDAVTNGTGAATTPGTTAANAVTVDPQQVAAAVTNLFAQKLGG